MTNIEHLTCSQVSPSMARPSIPCVGQRAPGSAPECVLTETDRAPAANAAGQDDDDLENALVLFDFGLGFALCHRDFGATRQAVKKLQADFKVIRTLISRDRAPATSAATQALTDDQIWAAFNAMHRVFIDGCIKGKLIDAGRAILAPRPTAKGAAGQEGA